MTRLTSLTNPLETSMSKDTVNQNGTTRAKTRTENEMMNRLGETNQAERNAER